MISKNQRYPAPAVAALVLAVGIMISFAACAAPADKPAAPVDKPSAPAKVHADADGLALTPPMGWYPWNIFGEEPQTRSSSARSPRPSSRAG